MDVSPKKWPTRAIAAVLSVLLVVPTSVFAFADENVGGRAGAVTITADEQLAPFFPDANFRAAVFKAVKGGQDKAEGASVEEALANFVGDVSAKNKGIENITGLEKLRRANKVDLTKNNISDFSHLVKQSSSGSAGTKYYGLTPDELNALADDGYDRDQGTDVYWIFDGNPMASLPENFGGRLVIKQPGSSSYTYPEDLSTTFTYVRNGTDSISGEMRIAKAYVETGNAKTPASLESVSWNSHGEANAVPFDVNWTKGNNETTFFSNLKKSGHAYIGIGTGEVLHYWTDDELGTSTPGSQSMKYYLTPRFYVYDKVTINSAAAKGSATLTKTDEASGKEVAGAVFSLYRQGGEVVKEGLTTDANGKVAVEDLDPGSYYFKETAAPAGYQLNVAQIPVEVKTSTVLLGGGLSEVTPSGGTPVKAADNEAFIAGPHDNAGKSPDITLDAGSSAVKSVKVSYASLDGKAATRTFATAGAAQTDINNEKNANAITGPVSIDVEYEAAAAGAGSVQVSATNRQIPLTDISVTKVWKDHINYDGPHPPAKIWLLQDGKKLDDVQYGSPWQVDPSNAEPGKDVTITHKFTNLPATDAAGRTYQYSVYEEPIKSPDDPSPDRPGYQSTTKGDAASGFTVANQWVPEAIISLSGQKTWSDLNAETRPSSVDLTLTRTNGDAGDDWSTTATASAANGWKFDFQGVPLWKDEPNKVRYQYQLTEKAVDDYTSFAPLAVSFPEGTGDKDVVEIPPADTTNTFSANDVAVLEGKKVWKGDFDGKTGTRASIKVSLMQNGVEYADRAPVMVSAPNWTYRFENLPKYAPDGTRYVYSVQEESVPVGYASEVSVDGTFITNTFNNNIVSVSGQKEWVDSGDDFSTRPETLPIELLQNGNTIRTFSTTAALSWKFSFVNLPKYDESGKAYAYTVKEPDLKSYDSTLSIDADPSDPSGNSYKASLENTLKTTQVKGTKTWIDNPDWTGEKPFITVRLFNEATNEEVSRQILVTAPGSSTKSYEFNGLPAVDKEGQPIKYVVKEDPVPGYSTTYTGTGNVNITNDWMGTDETDLQVNKTWVDNDNAFKTRPSEIALELYQKIGAGAETLAKTVTVKPTAEGTWSYTFTKLPVFDNHVRITYRVAEKAVPGYESVATPVVKGKALVTNTLKTTSVQGKKIWIDNQGWTGSTPSITVRLVNKTTQEEVAHLTLDAATANTEVSFAFEDVPAVGPDGKDIEYEVKEDPVAGYETTYSTEGKTLVVENEWTGVGETSLTVNKEWADYRNALKTRPDEISLELYKKVGDADEVLEKTVAVQPGAEGVWSYTFDKLPLFENHVGVEYRAAEKAVPNYTATTEAVDEKTTLITNTLDPKANDVVSVSLEKKWSDAGSTTARPGTITVSLLKNGAALRDIELSASGGWKAAATKLPKFDAEGNAYAYTIKEASVPGYKLADHVWTQSADGNSWTGTLTNAKLNPGDPQEPGPKKLVATGDGLVIPLVSLSLAVCAGGAALLMARARQPGKKRK